MCTRIFNHLNDQFPMTARNVDWFSTIDTYFYAFAGGSHNTGLKPKLAKKNKIHEQDIKKWQSKYASLATVIGNDVDGYATIDGLNQKGLAVNALYDCDTSYQKPNYQLTAKATNKPRKCLSSNYWIQFILDKFANVQEVCDYFAKQNIQLVPDLVPGFTLPAGVELPKGIDGIYSFIHVCVSDSSGDSAVIEVRNGEYQIHQNPKYTVVTNEPDFNTQKKLTAYWQYIWGLDPNAKVEAPVYSAPGGNTSTQRFERANYYLSFAKRPVDRHEARYQTRALVATCSVPVKFQTPDEPVSSYTIWSNLADHTKKRYYLTSTVSMNTVWMDFPKELNQSKRLFLQHQGFTKSENNSLAGNVTSLLEDCQNPYV